MCLDLVHLTSASSEIMTKTATCEITSTSGVYPINGTITLTQEVGIIIFVLMKIGFTFL